LYTPPVTSWKLVLPEGSALTARRQLTTVGSMTGETEEGDTGAQAKSRKKQCRMRETRNRQTRTRIKLIKVKKISHQSKEKNLNQ